MDPPNLDDDPDQEDDCFFDALDEFPFHDCIANDQSEQSSSDSTSSVTVISSPSTALRRRSISSRAVASSGSKDPDLASTSIRSNVTESNDPKTRYRERRRKIYRDLKGNGKNLEKSDSSVTSGGQVDSSQVDCFRETKRKEDSTVTVANEDRGGDLVDELAGSSSSNFLVLIAGLIIKAIAFQVNLIIHFITFPINVLYWSYMLVTDPFGIMRRCRGCLTRKVKSLWSSVGGMFYSLVSDWLKEHETIWKLLFQFGWGLFWSLYVCIILCGLLVLSIIVSGFLMRYLVEEPIQMKEELSLDYTKNSPVAFVPLISCYDDGYCKNNFGFVKSVQSRVIPANHKLQVSVLLTLPESEYNRNLGIFQVRVEFLSADGKILASKSRPYMLKFRSEAIRFLSTFLKIVPLVAGYVSESQTLEVNIKGFIEGSVPTSCLKVVIEQRAEFRPGAGIPEIYDASIVLESELPFFRRIIWCWKKTLFVWISIMSFTMELAFTLLCCRSVVIPKFRPRGASVSNNTVINNPHNNVHMWPSQDDTDGTKD